MSEDTIAIRLAHAMRVASVGVGDLSPLVGVDRSTVYRWLSGATVPSVQQGRRIATALDVSLDWLAGGSDQ